MPTRYSDPRLRELLAAEYALGSLRGRARDRFRSLMRYDRGLQLEVAQWEARLQPIADRLPERQPPARVWQTIGSRLGHESPEVALAATASAATHGQPPSTRSRWGLAWWRGLAVAMALSTISLAIVLRTNDQPATGGPGTAASGGMMAILTDASAQPTMLVSWPMQARSDGKVELRVRIIMDHPTMDANTSWQLWLMPADANARPQSVGLVGIEPEQRLLVDAAMLKALSEGSGMALSNEPAGGSPSGAPSGPVIFRGPCIKV